MSFLLIILFPILTSTLISPPRACLLLHMFTLLLAVPVAHDRLNVTTTAAAGDQCWVHSVVPC